MMATTTACLSCLGDGVLYYRRCRHSGACPCEEYERPCEACRGTGEEQCEFCGEASAEVDTRWGRYCVECAERETDDRQEAA